MSHETHKYHKATNLSYSPWKYCFYDISFSFYIAVSARVLDTYNSLLNDIPNALHQLV